jgi:heat shock protein HtpX
MWEAIRSNERKSWVLISIMAAALIALGFGIGFYVDPQFGGAIGALIAIGVWFIMLMVAFFQGDRVLMMGGRAKRIEKQDAPRLWNIVEEMTIASGLGKMPKVYIIDDDMPNAFAAGRKPEVAVVAVTSGLLQRLNRDELQGVIAHEIGHIRNLDIRFMTIAAVMVGSIAIISEIFLRSLWFGGPRRRSSGSGGGQAQLIILVVVIALAILAPIFAQMLYFACSRRREYLADASAARFTRYPDGLASALQRIASKPRQRRKVNRVLAPLYIVNPLQTMSAAGLFSTHPATEARIRILRGMGKSADFAAYEEAYRQVHGAKSHCLNEDVIKGDEKVSVRTPFADLDKKKDAVERAREVADVLDRFAEFLVFACPCGVRIKIPPDLKRDQLTCPRCGRKHDVPKAVAAATAAPGATTPAPSGEIESTLKTAKPFPSAPAPEPPATAAPVPTATTARPTAKMRYIRKATGWESFKCACGKTIQLSPSFSAKHIDCPNCKGRITISSA